MSEHHHHHPHKREIRVSFEEFLEQFPILPLPITLSEETARAFSKENDVLPSLVVEQYMVPLEGEEIDEWTEFVPCFRFPDTKDFHAIVYWKAGLLQYYFVLATFSNKGELINRRILAGTFVRGNLVTQSVATIDQDWIITIVTGQGRGEEDALYDASSSKTLAMEVMPNGLIVDETPE
jgi:hypothetical protein